MKQNFKTHKAYCLIFILCNFLIVSHVIAESKSKLTLQKEINHLVADPKFKNALWGIEIASAKSGEVLYSLNEYKLFMPASCLKLFTSAAALVKLGPDFKYTTPVYIHGNLFDSTLQGDLIIKGSGDPNISGRFHNTVTEVLENWADSIKSKGIKIIEGDIVADNTLFDNILMGPGWAWDYHQYWFAAQISALSFNDNCVNMSISPGKNAGDPVDIRIDPDTRYVTIINQVITGKEGSERSIDFDRKQSTNIIEVIGSLEIDEKPLLRWATIDEPAAYTATVFKEILELKGVTVKGTVKVVNLPESSPIKEGDVIITSYESPPLSEIIKIINVKSQNFYAEQVLKTLGAKFKGEGSFSKGTEVVEEFLEEELGIPAKEYQMVDGSGLSRLNLVTPHQITRLLIYMHNHPLGKVYYASLPVAGVSGPIKNRMVGTAAQDNLRGKTGYLGMVSSLSGYVTSKKGEILVFAIIVNNHLNPENEAIKIEDKIGQLLAN